MELLTKRCIIEQSRAVGVLDLSIPKRYIKDRGLEPKDKIHIRELQVNKKLVMEVAEYSLENGIEVSIISSGGYCRFTIPKSIQGHGKDSQWNVYTNNNGLLRYELIK